MSGTEDITQLLADARTIYEGTHGLTISELADVTGLPRRALAGQRNAEQWAKTIKEGQSPEAAAAVIRFAEWRAASAKAAEAQAREVAEAESNIPDLARPVVEDELAKLLERHKQEWMAPRAISAEAVKIRATNPTEAFNRAKLAKITAETLEIVQKGERRAHGIDDKDAPHGAVVVVERYND